MTVGSRDTTCPQPGQVALAEYEQLKTEQIARIGFRDNLIYVTLVAIAGTLTVAHASHGHGYLLLVPAVTFVLGWTYLANDHMISAIGRYVRDCPALPMSWETAHASDGRRRSRKAIQLAVDLMVFCGSGAAALAAFWASPDPALIQVLASAAEAAAAAVLAWQFTAYALRAAAPEGD